MSALDLALSSAVKEEIFSDVPFADQIIAYLTFLKTAGLTAKMHAFLNKKEFKDNPEFLIKIVENNPAFYDALPFAFKMKAELVSVYVNDYVGDIHEVPDEFWLTNKEVVTKVLEKGGTLIKSMPDEIKYDINFIRLALTNDGLALSVYLDPDVNYMWDKNPPEMALGGLVRDNKELIMLAITQTLSASTYASERLKADEDILIHMVRSMEGPQFDSVSNEIKRNPIFLTETLACFPTSFANLIRRGNDFSRDELWLKVKKRLFNKSEEFFIESFNNIDNPVNKLWFCQDFMDEVLSHISMPALSLLRTTKKDVDGCTAECVNKFDVLEEHILERHNDVLRDDLKVLNQSPSVITKKKTRKLK